MIRSAGSRDKQDGGSQGASTANFPHARRHDLRSGLGLLNGKGTLTMRTMGAPRVRVKICRIS